MEGIYIIGIDLAKQSFQLHGARGDGSVAFRKKLTRGKVLGFLASQPRCLVAMEACAGAHYWGREIGKLGHEVKLVPPVYVKPYVKRHKNDAADAEAICEAATRATMRFVAVKSEAQQARGMLFRTRDLLVRQRTQTINALRGHSGGVRGRRAARAGAPHAIGGGGWRPGFGPARGGPRTGRGSAGANRRPQSEDTGVGQKAPGERLRGRRGEAVDEHPGDRADYRVGDPGLRAAGGELPAGSGLLRLARAGPPATLHGRQAPSGQDIEDGPARREAAVDHGCDVGGALGCPARCAAGFVARPDVGAQAEDARRGGAGQ